MVELIFALFLLSGFVKFFFMTVLAGVPMVDVTLLTAVLLVLFYGFQVLKDLVSSRFFILSGVRSLVVILGGLYLWMIISLIYTSSPAFSYLKTLLFLTCVMALFFPFFYRGFRSEKFFKYFVYIGSGLILIYTALLPNIFAGYKQFYQDREFVVKYLDMGYIAGIIILVIAFACPGMKRLVRVLFIGLNGWAMLITAARGPIFFLGFVLFIKWSVGAVHFLKANWRFSVRNLVYMTLGLAILGSGVYYFLERYALLIERTLTRLLLVFDPYTASISERLNQITFSIETIFSDVSHFLFGLGIGSFGVEYSGYDELAYPHNVILEIGFEMGIVGVLLFSLFILVYFWKIHRAFNYLLVFIYLLLNSLKSYSLVSSRVMFGIMGVMLFTYLLAQREKEIKT